MRMAKATQADIDRVIRFFNTIDEFMDYGSIPSDSTSYDDPDSIEDVTDEQFVERLRELWGGPCGPALVDGSWRRVVFGMQVLVDNVCDKSATVLELRKDWKAAIGELENAENPT